MHVVTWVLQIVLAAGFAFAGAMKLTQPKEKLAPNMGWVEDVPAGTVKLIGALELLAAIGLILPSATGIAPVLTPLAAVGIAVIMLLALGVHLRRHEAQVIPINLLLLALAVVVAWSRFGPYSY